jgi:cytochrome b
MKSAIRETTPTHDRSVWGDISIAPFGRDLELAVIEGGSLHALVFACRRAHNGWINAQTIVSPRRIGVLGPLMISSIPSTRTAALSDCLSTQPPAPSSSNCNGSAMALTYGGIEAGGATPPATVKVWDPFVRVFHWTLLTLFVVALVTGDEMEGVHIAAGTASRSCWRCVLFGRHWSAQCSAFQLCAVATRGAGLLSGSREPQGSALSWSQPRRGVMIVALLAALVGTAATGYMMTTDAYWERDGSRRFTRRSPMAHWRWPVCMCAVSPPQACCIVRIWSKRCGRDASGHCESNNRRGAATAPRRVTR